MNTQRFLLPMLLVAALALSACGGGATAQPTAPPPTQALEPVEPEPTQPPEPAAEAAVSIVDSSFADGAITIPVGTTVTWTHDGQYPHTVTADDGSFDSDTLNGDDTFSYTFDQAGTYAYYCEFHGGPGGAGMSGTITVTDE